MKYLSAFDKWLHRPQPTWKQNLDKCDDKLFTEIELTKEEITTLLEKLDEFEIFNERKQP